MDRSVEPSPSGPAAGWALLPAEDQARLAHECELAQQFFPVEWARAKNAKQRARLRKSAVAEAALIPLREAGASCRTCAHRSRLPSDDKQPTCDLDSDFYGYALTTLDGLCHRWERRA